MVMTNRPENPTVFDAKYQLKNQGCSDASLPGGEMTTWEARVDQCILFDS
jgi:hypothetical protein